MNYLLLPDSHFLRKNSFSAILFLSTAGPSTEPSVVESKDRKANAHFILKLLCDSVVLQPYLRELLSAK